MESKKKILVIRFNSIGDIVLTTAVLEALHEANYEVHYLMKSPYKELLADCPYISRIWCLENSLRATIKDLKNENFNIVVDLHNNLRSWRVRWALRKKAYVLKKHRIAMWVMIQTGMFRQQQRHIVLRFLDTIRDLVNVPAAPRIELFLPEGRKKIGDYTDRFTDYHVIVVGAAFYNKTIPPQLLVSIIDSSDKNIVLIGGPEDSENATIISAETKSPVLNLTGQLSLMESASIIADAEAVISGDTGMMHIADALKVKTIAVFGSTHPILGFTPFNRDNIASSIIQNDDLSCRPCTKQGKDFCPKGHFKCMLDLKIGDIVDKM